MVNFSTCIEEFHIPLFCADPKFFRTLLEVELSFFPHLFFSIT